MSMKVFLLAFVLATALVVHVCADEQIDALMKLQKLRDLGLLGEAEYTSRREQILDSYLGVSSEKNEFQKGKYQYYRRSVRPLKDDKDVGNWTMPVVWTPQVDWLVSIFNHNMPRSYDDTIPYTGLSFWRSHLYLTFGARDWAGNRVPFDHDIAMQERALSHVGLNIYDGGVWGVALALSGLGGLVDVYHRNVLMTSSTGANVQVGGLKSIRAWEPNPDPLHPPDLFYYGKERITNEDMEKVRMPANMTFVRFEEGCDCPTSGCCAQEGLEEIPGNYFYRMIGPSYIMDDPLQGKYGHVWRAEPAGPNTDEAQYWNLAGIVHWNDWKPITGENVWGGILGPLQTMFIKNCSHVPTFSTYEEAPMEVQLAVSLIPASKALLSPLGSMYHCPLGTKMYPPDDDEATNVSNENNFSAMSAFKALKFVFDNFYAGGDAYLDKARELNEELIEGLSGWFKKYLLPDKIAGEWVISQGGHVTFDGNYEYQEGDQGFAVDCQTWGLLVVGQKEFDAAYSGKTTAYQVWQNAKKLAGYYIGGEIAGVGYTVPSDYTNTSKKHDIWSGEWTWGAVFMTRKLASEIGKHDWAASLNKDAQSMVKHMRQEVKPGPDGVWSGGGLVQVDGSYLYANARFFIPWGWYANPIGSTASTGWAVYWDYLYNPFELGGGFNTTFYDTQCKENPPDKEILQKLGQYYGYGK